MLTQDSLFDGRIRVAQPRKGYRFSADAPLLVWFACVTAERRAQLALDLGTGCGVVALGLLAVKKAEKAVAVEVQERLCDLAVRNAAANGFQGRLEIIRGDMRESALLRGRLFDLVVSNPPFWSANDGRVSEDDERRIACHEVLVDLEGWVGAAARSLEPRRGRLCAVFPARRLKELFACCARQDLCVGSLLAVHPRPGENAELVLVEARRGAGRPLSVLPPLFLRGEGNEETEAARAILSGRFSAELAALPDLRQ